MSQRYQGGFLTASYFPLKVPDAPTIGTATGGNASASVTFTAPSNVGGGAITGYTVISSPSGFTGTGASSPITVSGLSNGTAYTFTVVATNAYGTGPASAASNSVTPVAPVITSSVDYLVVAGGGGGGGGTYAGGGGAGGYRTASSFAVSAGTPITVTVGAGGAVEVNGSNSVFSSITSAGGGYGSVSTNGSSGGSGGGSYGYPNGAYTGGAGNTPSTSPSQGNNGGNGISDNVSYTNSGGGGGAGAVGGNATSSQSGNGGNGLASSITGTSVTRGGGGGAGSHPAGGSPGTGGTGGGGNGGFSPNNGTPGTANTGGGSGSNNTGGSGIVIIRYADTFDAASATTGSPTVTVTGGYRIYQWTSSGSITF